jgi:hypothetical protein
MSRRGAQPAAIPAHAQRARSAHGVVQIRRQLEQRGGLSRQPRISDAPLRCAEAGRASGAVNVAVNVAGNVVAQPGGSTYPRIADPPNCVRCA